MIFLGNVNVFDAKRIDTRLTNGEAWLKAPESSDQAAQEGHVYIRPHELVLNNQPTAQASIALRVIAVNPIGPEVRVELEPYQWHSTTLWEADLSHPDYDRNPVTRGDIVYAQPTAGYFFRADTDQAPEHVSWP